MSKTRLNSNMSDELYNMKKFATTVIATASNKIKNTNTEKMSTSNLIISKLIDKILQLDNSITTAELIHIVCVDAYNRKQKHLAKNKILEVIQLSNNSKQIALNDEKKKKNYLQKI